MTNQVAERIVVILVAAQYEHPDVMGVLMVPRDTPDKAIEEVFEFYREQRREWAQTRAAWWAIEKELRIWGSNERVGSVQDAALARYDARFPPPPALPTLEIVARQVLGRVVEDWSVVEWIKPDDVLGLS